MDGSICLIAADLDGFKQINDEHGHARGDAALRDAAYEMRKALRNFELFYRLGGEEFLVILPGVHLSAGARAAERMRDAVESSSPGSTISPPCTPKRRKSHGANSRLHDRLIVPMTAEYTPRNDASCSSCG